MNLLVPTDFSDELLDALAPHAGRITLYGRAPEEPLGGGRSSLFLPDPGDAGILRHVERARALGFRFNYLQNAACTGGAETRSGASRALARRLEWLRALAPDEITVCHPFVLEAVRAHIPRARIAVGFAAQVDSLRKARAWAEAGAHSLTPAVAVNRNFPLLRSLASESGLEIVPLATLTCLPDCHRASACMNALAHLSEETAERPDLPAAFPLLCCTHEKLAAPWKLLSAPFIRPEDQAPYRAAGVTRLKLTDRFDGHERIAAKVAAYFAGRYDGDLLDLLSFRLASRDGAFRGARRHLPRDRREGALELERRLRLSTMPLPRIDNRALDGFLDPFVAGTIDCAARSCDACGHCRAYAERAVKLDPAAAREACTRFDAFRADWAALFPERPSPDG